jgi:hypothetical protein
MERICSVCGKDISSRGITSTKCKECRKEEKRLYNIEYREKHKSTCKNYSLSKQEKKNLKA